MPFVALAPLGNCAGDTRVVASGGLRVIYFVRYQPNEFWMLALYAKAKQENVPARISSGNYHKEGVRT